MERLTERNKAGRAIFAGDDTPIGNALRLGDILGRLADYEDTGLTPDEVKGFMQKVKSITELCERLDFQKVKDLSRIAQEGRLFIQPIKVGHKVYSVTYDEVSCEYIVGEPEEIVEVGTKGFFLAWDSEPGYPVEFHLYEEIGKEFFLNIEDALQAKRKMEETK